MTTTQSQHLVLKGLDRFFIFHTNTILDLFFEHNDRIIILFHAAHGTLD